MANLSWAMTLFGARQIGNLALVDTARATAAFEAVVEATRRGLGEDWDRVFGAGERWQSRTLERLMTGSRESIELGLGMLEVSATALEAVPGQGSAALELTNKIQAFRAFQFVDRRLGVRGELPLPALVEKAAGLGPYRGLWATEGLGFAHAERGWRDRRATESLARQPEVPASALIPLHTGMGLSLAVRALGGIDTRGEDQALLAAVERFLTLCEASSAAGCQPMAFEALGLVVRTLYPHLLRRVDRLLATIDPRLVDYYWHSVGRGLYFAPTHVLPGFGGWQRALEKARREPPHATGRRNALAGFAWALTLVNFRHPEVLAGLLRDHGDEIFDRSAFANGVSSAFLIWYSANGREALLERFLAYRPQRSVAARWRRLVREPTEDALDSYIARGRDRAPAGLFRCQAAGADPEYASRYDGAELGPKLPAAISRGLDGWIGRTVQAFSRSASPPGPGIEQ